MKKISIQLIILLSLFFKATAQEDRRLNFDNMYFFGQFGRIAGYDNYVNGGAYLQYESHYFRLSFGGAYDNETEEQKKFHESHRNCDCSVDTRGIEAVNFEYGRVLKFFRRQQINFSSGVSVVTKIDLDEMFNQNKQPWEQEKFFKKVTVGLPYEVRYSLMINRGIGLACSYYGNVNPKKSFNALSFGVAVGLF